MPSHNVDLAANRFAAGTGSDLHAASRRVLTRHGPASHGDGAAVPGVARAGHQRERPTGALGRVSSCQGNLTAGTHGGLSSRHGDDTTDTLAPAVGGLQCQRPTVQHVAGTGLDRHVPPVCLLICRAPRGHVDGTTDTVRARPDGDVDRTARAPV